MRRGGANGPRQTPQHVRASHRKAITGYRVVRSLLSAIVCSRAAWLAMILWMAAQRYRLGAIRNHSSVASR